MEIIYLYIILYVYMYHLASGQKTLENNKMAVS